MHLVSTHSLSTATNRFSVSPPGPPLEPPAPGRAAPALCSAVTTTTLKKVLRKRAGQRGAYIDREPGADNKRERSHISWDGPGTLRPVYPPAGPARAGPEPG